MQRVCFLLRVDPERLDEYKERHRNVWPEMRDALREAGWGNYSLFLRDDGLLVGYVETEDFEAALSYVPIGEGEDDLFAGLGSVHDADALATAADLTIAHDRRPQESR